MSALLSILVLAASTFAAPSTLSSPALCSSAPAPMEQANFVSGITVQSTCTADCGSSHPSVSCSGGTCNAVNRSCPEEPGHVTCGTTTLYCAACANECINGRTKNVTVGPICSCADGMTTPKEHYLCVGGEWEYQYSFCGGPFCQGY